MLHVITVVYNPCGFRSRYENYARFCQMIAASGATLWTVELAIGDQPFRIANSEYVIRLRSDQALWYKENLINIALKRLPQDWSYAAWVDADVHFARPDWVEQTIRSLGDCKIVQMFSEFIALDPESRVDGLICPSFMAAFHAKRDGRVIPGRSFTGRMPPGGAWAIRRDAFDAIGEIGDIGIAGSGDDHMAHALVGRVRASLPKGLSTGYSDYWLAWQEKAANAIGAGVGVVEGLLLHYWHGNYESRQYRQRWAILIRNEFDPVVDLYRSTTGLLRLTDRRPSIQTELLRYFESRNEDSLDMAGPKKRIHPDEVYIRR